MFIQDIAGFIWKTDAADTKVSARDKTEREGWYTNTLKAVICTI